MDLTIFAYFDKYLDSAKLQRIWLELVNKNNYRRVTKPLKKEKEEICQSASAIALQPSVIINVFSTAPCAMCAYT